MYEVPVPQILDNFYIENRILFINGIIDNITSVNFIRELIYLDSINHNQITVYMNSQGGSIEQGFAMYDTIKFIKSKVKMVVTGIAYSMGGIILQAADERCMTKNSFLMIHQGASYCEGKLDKLKAEFESLDKMQKVINDIFTNRAGLKEIPKTEVYYNSEECLKLNLIDKILEDV